MIFSLYITKNITENMANYKKTGTVTLFDTQNIKENLSEL